MLNMLNYPTRQLFESNLILERYATASLEFGGTSPGGVFGIGAYFLASLALCLLFVNNPFLRFDPLFLFGRWAFLFALEWVVVILVDSHTTTRHESSFQHRLLLLFAVAAVAGVSVKAQNEVMFFGLGRIGIIHHDATGESNGRGTLGNEHGLFGCFGIKLQNGPSTSPQDPVQ